ncbi:MAG: hypothetical protein B7Y83_18325 [Flavobacteriales bacterium 32-34-25]|nr:MAG: hypothetical protein B7Y83_18325 [Flavobacteriales bacterium 32-34-25]
MVRLKGLEIAILSCFLRKAKVRKKEFWFQFWFHEDSQRKSQRHTKKNLFKKIFAKLSVFFASLCVANKKYHLASLIR